MCPDKRLAYMGNGRQSYAKISAEEHVNNVTDILVNEGGLMGT